MSESANVSATLSAASVQARARSRRQRQMRETLSAGAVLVLLLLFGLSFTLPLFWMASTSLKTNEQLVSLQPVWIPNPLNWVNYVRAIDSMNFLQQTRSDRTARSAICPRTGCLAHLRHCLGPGCDGCQDFGFPDVEAYANQRPPVGDALTRASREQFRRGVHRFGKLA